MAENSSPPSVAHVLRWARFILGPERGSYILAAIYTIGISLLSLATPISVQLLINTVANIGLTTPLIVLSLSLFVLLLLSGLLNALRIHLLDVFARRFYARMVSEISLRAVFARDPFFLDDSQLPLFNRYFDIVIIQKSLPYLLIGGLTVVLQAGIGFVLVSLYHPLFLVFNLVIILVIWLIWVIWGKAAIRSAVALSHRKHETAAWLEQLGASDGFFKLDRHTSAALDRTERLTANYVDAHRGYFRKHFAQTLSFLLLYAIASATLLGLGGWLVIRGELTLGQLVAAELVLSAAFFGLSQLGLYLSYFYDSCAAVDELSLFFNIDQEDRHGAARVDVMSSDIEFAHVEGEGRSGGAVLNLKIPAGRTLRVRSSDHGIQRLLSNILKGQIRPQRGYVTLGKHDISAMDLDQLREEIVVLDRPTGIETTIREYLQLIAPGINSERIWNVLEIAGIREQVARLPHALETRLASTGWPLSLTETLRLKLAATVVTGPRVLVLTKLFDAISPNCIRRVMTALREEQGSTLLYFSSREIEDFFDGYVFLDHDRQWLADDVAEVEHLVAGDF